MASFRSNQGQAAHWSAVFGIFCIVVNSLSPQLVSADEAFADVIFAPDLSFTSHSVFHTEMVSEDLDAARKQEIKSQLEPQLAAVFKNITGFKSVEVTVITIDEFDRNLLANWTVRLNRDDPNFVNSTPEEIGNIVRPELEAASTRYKERIILDTSKHARPSTSGSDDNNSLALGLGLGLGLGIPVLALIILVVVLVTRRTKKQRLQKPKSVSDVTSSYNSGQSSQMDGMDYTRNVHGHGGFIPSISGKSAPSSVSGRSDDYISPIIYDTLSVSAPSEASGDYAVLNFNPSDRSFRPRQ